MSRQKRQLFESLSETVVVDGLLWRSIVVGILYGLRNESLVGDHSHWLSFDHVGVGRPVFLDGVVPARAKRIDVKPATDHEAQVEHHLLGQPPEAVTQLPGQK